MTSLDHPGIRKVVAALAEAELPDTAEGARVLDAAVRTAAKAAEAVRVPVGAIATSLGSVAWHPRAIFPTTCDPMVALTGGTPVDVAGVPA